MRRSFLSITILLFFLGVFVSNCYRMRKSNGGGQIASIPQRTIDASDIALHPGYKIEAVATGLTFPTAVTTDDEGGLFVIEAGYSYGEIFGEPKLLRIENGGRTTVVTTGPRNGPWSGITFHDGNFYIAEGGQMDGGRILRISKSGAISSLISNLPSFGDHHTNGPVIKDGYIYFSIGTATNAGVVGEDNAEFGWLPRKQTFHDIPCKDIVVTGQNYTTANLLTENRVDKATTGPFSAFGTPTTAGQVIKGVVPCSGSVLRMPLQGGQPELVAWGFRNPFGLATAPDGKLFVTENGYDERGSRPVWGAGDVLWEIKPDRWYGWPDFSGAKPISNDEEFKVPGKDPVKPLLQQVPNPVPQPVAIFGVHTSSNGLDFSRSQDFGFLGEAFVAQFGDMAPEAGKVLAPVGFKIVRVNVNTGVIRDFATNRGARNGPASWLKSGGLERPVSVKFDAAGKVLYVVDFGIMKLTENGPEPQPGTGVVWKITKN
ncbi:PQQ-dependent sugar dehydrogenase [Flavisolibacter sp. BT320]|nr:PQQ-dependent sugar dehydrogenase [Flavisolibacter longurius]